MPIIEHGTVPMPVVIDRQCQRALVSKQQGAQSLTINEVELHPGWEGRLHTHPTDVAIMVMAGAVQMVLGNELRTVRTGFTLFAPPGVPHKLVNHLWIPVRVLVICPTTELETDYLE